MAIRFYIYRVLSSLERMDNPRQNQSQRTSEEISSSSRRRPAEEDLELSWAWEDQMSQSVQQMLSSYRLLLRRQEQLRSAVMSAPATDLDRGDSSNAFSASLQNMPALPPHLALALQTHSSALVNECLTQN